jgi:hypothetical protein
MAAHDSGSSGLPFGFPDWPGLKLVEDLAIFPVFTLFNLVIHHTTEKEKTQLPHQLDTEYF